MESLAKLARRFAEMPYLQNQEGDQIAGAVLQNTLGVAAWSYTK